MRPFGQYLLRSCAFPQYVIFTVPCIHKCTWTTSIIYSYDIYIYLEHPKMHILQYNKKGSVAWMETIIQYNSNPGWIQIRESDPVLVNKTQLVTKRNYSNNPKTTSNLTNKAPRHYNFQSNKLLVAWEFSTIDNGESTCLLLDSNCPIWVASKKHSCSKLLSDSDNLTARLVCLGISEVVAQSQSFPQRRWKTRRPWCHDDALR